MCAKFGRDPMAGSKKVTLKFIIGFNLSSIMIAYVFHAFFPRKTTAELYNY